MDKVIITLMLIFFLSILSIFFKNIWRKVKKTQEDPIANKWTATEVLSMVFGLVFMGGFGYVLGEMAIQVLL